MVLVQFNLSPVVLLQRHDRYSSSDLLLNSPHSAPAFSQLLRLGQRWYEYSKMVAHANTDSGSKRARRTDHSPIGGLFSGLRGLLAKVQPRNTQPPEICSQIITSKFKACKHWFHP